MRQWIAPPKSAAPGSRAKTRIIGRGSGTDMGEALPAHASVFLDGQACWLGQTTQRSGSCRRDWTSVSTRRRPPRCPESRPAPGDPTTGPASLSHWPW